MIETSGGNVDLIGGESPLPCYEVRKSFDLVRRFHRAQTSYRSGALRRALRRLLTE
jgi:hypothetical protein